MKKQLTIFAAISLAVGCNTATPASRANTGRYESSVRLEHCTNCTVNVTQQILSSADGEGDQTANPVQTNDIKPDTTLTLSTSKGATACGDAKTAGGVSAEDCAACSDNAPK